MIFPTEVVTDQLSKAVVSPPDGFIMSHQIYQYLVDRNIDVTHMDVVRYYERDDETISETLEDKPDSNKLRPMVETPYGRKWYCDLYFQMYLPHDKAVELVRLFMGETRDDILRRTMEELDPDKVKFTKDGYPFVEDIEGISGLSDISSDERSKYWDEYCEGLHG